MSGSPLANLALVRGPSLHQRVDLLETQVSRILSVQKKHTKEFDDVHVVADNVLSTAMSLNDMREWFDAERPDKLNAKKAKKAMKATNAMAAMKAMKSMKSMKVMKSMKTMKGKRATIAKGKRARAIVFGGGKDKTKSGLTKNDLTKSKTGKIISKAASNASKSRFACNKKGQSWQKACQKAREELHIKGFVPIGGKTVAGQAFYAKAKEIYDTEQDSP